MKTSFRILTMSLVALVAFTFVSKTFAVSMNFSKIMWTSSSGKVTEVTVDENGHFKTPPMAAGKYTYSWSLISKPTGSSAKFWGVGRGIGSTMGGSPDREASAPSVSEIDASQSPGSANREASAPSVSEIVVSHEIMAPRDAQSGMATGKRMHKPFVITKELDKSTPLLKTSLGSFVVDEDCDGITGTITYKSATGDVMKPTWDIKSAK